MRANYLSSCETDWESKPQGRTIPDSATCSSIDVRLQEQGRKTSTVCYSLPETAAPVAIAATVVGAAITLLVRRNKPTEPDKVTCLIFMAQKGCIWERALKIRCHHTIDY